MNNQETFISNSFNQILYLIHLKESRKKEEKKHVQQSFDENLDINL